jgi:predicted RNA polymerase sigma factor
MDAAREHYREASALARNPAERRFLERRIADCQPDDAKNSSAK